MFDCRGHFDFCKVQNSIGAGVIAGVVALAGIAEAGAPVTAAPSMSAPIRTTAGNRVPACITPERLDGYLREKNSKLAERFRGIATHYRRFGEVHRVRWDLAFYQMLLETNHLTFMRGPGRPGDVRPQQNNFAGLGATGRGVRGEAFPDVATGVQAHIQHLVAYSGEIVADPVAKRTRDNQDDIVKLARRKNRPVTFRDLTNRWAIDNSYARSLTAIAERVHESVCHDIPAHRETIAGTAGIAPPGAEGKGRAGDRHRRGEAKGSRTAAAGGKAGPAAGDASGEAPVAARCRVWSASYGGKKALLIRVENTGETHLTALEVLDGFEADMARSFIAKHAPNGRAVGEYPSKRAALDAAFAECRSTARAKHAVAE